MKRKITISIGRKLFSFRTDESKEKVQRIKDMIAEDYEHFGHNVEGKDNNNFEDLLVLMLLNHISREIKHEDTIKSEKEKNERLMVEIERMKTDRSDLVG
ncbi:MAG TPA: hypothetical protein PK466_06985 [Thermotogota bacterium]|nr:hypothetical protein [Thermotogota bacterium]HPJ88083.1 hypothetical protein [Thermotogota bacterium]HPR96057.1 hypothetical protein [Thermotogota bacterium]